MITHVTDTRSNTNDQVKTIATALSRSKRRLKVFEAIYRGGKNPKTVARLGEITGYSSVVVSQMAGLLYDLHYVGKVKVGKYWAYEKDGFIKTNLSKIIKGAKNPENLKDLPTKTNPQIIGAGRVSITVNGAKVRVKEVTFEHIDQFKAAKTIKNAPKHAIRVSESSFKEGVKKLIGEKGKFQDWGGESNDLFTNRAMVKGKRCRCAFAFKGPATRGELTPGKLGKNGDQIQRLFLAPAEIYFVQYHSQIAQSVLEQMKVHATVKSVLDNKTIYYGVMDGVDSDRLVAAYPKKFSLKKKKKT